MNNTGLIVEPAFSCRTVFRSFVLFVTITVSLQAGTVKGTLVPPDGATLDEFTISLGPVFGVGEQIHMDAKGRFKATVEGGEHTALLVRYHEQTIHTTLLYGLGSGAATLTLKVVPRSQTLTEIYSFIRMELLFSIEITPSWQMVTI